MSRSIARVLALASLLAGTAACGDDTPVVPDTPARQTVTETFEGSVTVNGARTHAFNVGGSGEVRATVTALGPDSAARIGLSLGTWNATQCQITIANDNATQASVVVGNAGAAGALCVRVYDIGQLTGQADYTLTVVHF